MADENSEKRWHWQVQLINCFRNTYVLTEVWFEGVQSDSYWSQLVIVSLGFDSDWGVTVYCCTCRISEGSISLLNCLHTVLNHKVFKLYDIYNMFGTECMNSNIIVTVTAR